MARPKTLGGSDVNRLMHGDWVALYEEKLGLREPADLSDVFRVQLGIHTENFHRDWQHVHARPNVTAGCLIERGDFHAALDARDAEDMAPWEFKHSHARNDLRNAAKYYAGQLHHYMDLSGYSFCYLSVICGNNDPEWGMIEMDPEYMESVKLSREQFLECVRSQTPPNPDLFNLATAVAQETASKMKIGGYRDVSMEGNNQWADAAHTYIDTKDFHADHEAAKKTLKKLVDKDVSSAEGHGIRVHRSKSGSLLIKEVG